MKRTPLSAVRARVERLTGQLAKDDNPPPDAAPDSQEYFCWVLEGCGGLARVLEDMYADERPTKAAQGASCEGR